MLKKILAVLAFALTLTAATTAQYHISFNTGGATNDLTGTQSILKVPGQINASASMGRDVDGTALPYHPTGINYGGFVIVDTSVAVPYRFGFDLSQLAGTTTADFFLFVDNNNTFANGGGYVFRFQQQAGSDIFRIGEYNAFTSTTPGVEDSATPRAMFNTAHGLISMSRNFNVGDSMMVYVWADRFTGVVKTGSSVDSITILLGGTEASHNITTGGLFRVGFGGIVRATPFKINSFFIQTAAAGAPPPADTDDDAPVVSTPIASRLTAYLGQPVVITTPATDDSALNTGITEVDTTVGGYHSITTEVVSGTQTAYTFTSATFTRYTAGTATVRLRVSDHNKNDAAIRRDTSATITVTFTEAPVIQSSGKKRFGYIPFAGGVAWPGVGGLASNAVPPDSLPWDALTHICTFASNGIPVANGYLVQFGPMATKAHEHGVYAGHSFGGSGDDQLRAMIADPNAWGPWIVYVLGLIDTYGLDFIDLDIEGATTLSNVAAFIARFNDSLQTRLTANLSDDPATTPFIVLTVGPSRAAAWVSLEPDVAFTNLMSYDYIGDWWGRLIHDSAPKSRQHWNGTGSVTDDYPPIGTANREAPSMQKGALAVLAAGWPNSKVLIGFDVNPTHWGPGGTFSGGRGPTYIRQPSTGNTPTGAADYDFRTIWPTMATWPADSIHFDQIAQAYWYHAGTSLVDDRVWTFLAYPGRDSAMWATRRIVDSMDLGGVMFWNVGIEVWGTSVVPPGGRGWFYDQIRTHFGPRDTSCSTLLNPPTTLSPAAEATGVALAAPFNWPDVAGVSATAGYNIRISTSPTMTTPLKDTNVTPSALTLAAGYLSYNTTYYYDLRAKSDSCGWGPRTQATAFTTVAAVPGMPQILSPVTGTTLAGTSTPVTWLPSTNGPILIPGANNFYQVHTSTSPSFATTFKNDSLPVPGVSTVYNLSGMSNSTTYYIRVRGKTVGGYSPWSPTVTITTGAAPPTPPTLAVPTNNEGNVDTAVTFQWTFPPNYWYFRFQLSTTPTFTTLASYSQTSSNTAVVTGLTPNTTYYWRVKTFGATDSSAYSAVFNFTTSQASDPPFPGSHYQMGIWYDLQCGCWIWDRPAPWVIYGFTRPDMSDVPAPDAGIIAWSVYGIKFKTDWGTDTTLLYSFGSIGGGDASPQTMYDSLRYAADLDSVHLQNPIVDGALLMQNPDTSDGTRYLAGFNPHNQRKHVYVDWPTKPGRMALAVGDALYPSYLDLSNNPLGSPSGGMGFNPAFINNLGLSTSLLFFGMRPNQQVFEAFTLEETITGFLKSPYATDAATDKLPISDPQRPNGWRYIPKDSVGGTNMTDAVADVMGASIRQDSSLELFDGATYRGRAYAEATGAYLEAPSGSASARVGIKAGFDGGSGVYSSAQEQEIVQTDSTEMLMRERTTFINSDGIRDTWMKHLVTSGNTPTVGVNFSLDSNLVGISDYSTDNVTYLVTMDVVGKKGGATGYAAYSRRLVYENNGGTVTEAAEQTIGTDVESNASLDCTFAVSGDYLQVTITGITAETWVWHIHMKIVPVGN